VLEPLVTTMARSCGSCASLAADAAGTAAAAVPGRTLGGFAADLMNGGTDALATDLTIPDTCSSRAKVAVIGSSRKVWAVPFRFLCRTAAGGGMDGHPMHAVAAFQSSFAAATSQLQSRRTAATPSQQSARTQRRPAFSLEMQQRTRCDVLLTATILPRTVQSSWSTARLAPLHAAARNVDAALAERLAQVTASNVLASTILAARSIAAAAALHSWILHGSCLTMAKMTTSGGSTHSARSRQARREPTRRPAARMSVLEAAAASRTTAPLATLAGQLAPLSLEKQSRRRAAALVARWLHVLSSSASLAAADHAPARTSWESIADATATAIDAASSFLSRWASAARIATSWMLAAAHTIVASTKTMCRKTQTMNMLLDRRTPGIQYWSVECCGSPVPSGHLGRLLHSL
jgi:hypothetical protein